MAVPNLIIGAGLTGLSCAHHLDAASVILEGNASVGGKARTVRRGGFSFDITGHWLHLRDLHVRSWVQALMGNKLMLVQRRAAVYSHGVYTQYPFQAHTCGLPTEVVAECLLGYFRAREQVARNELPEPVSFADYIHRRLGDGIARHFMIPYNTKLWTVPPSDMGHAWCDRFVPVPTPQEVVYGALTPGGAGHPLGYNASFFYPVEGGIGGLAQSLAAALPRRAELRLGVEVVRVHWHTRQVELANGDRIAYERLVSTAPLKQLVGGMDGVPETVLTALKKLRATTVTYWDVGVRRPPAPTDYHWIYFPETHVPFYRAGSLTAVAPSLAPPGHSSFYVETAHGQGSQCPVDDETVLAGLRDVGLLGKHEEPVVFVRSTIPCAYAILDHAYGAARQTVMDWLSTIGVISTGRYGAWVYDSMEGALQAGMRVGAAINQPASMEVPENTRF